MQRLRRGGDGEPQAHVSMHLYRKKTATSGLRQIAVKTFLCAFCSSCSRSPRSTSRVRSTLVSAFLLRSTATTFKVVAATAEVERPYNLTCYYFLTWILLEKVDRHHEFRFSRCLFVVRTNGDWEDFSYRKCLQAYIKEKYPSYADRFLQKHLVNRSELFRVRK